MAERKQIRCMATDEYLEFEEQAAVRHEYVRGQIFAMTGSAEAHNVISGNLFAALHNFLQGTGCRVFQNDMKVRVEAADCFYYPDIMVTCEPYEAKSVFKNSPRLIIEVLSPSTKHIDRREKLVAYRQLSSLRQYILVHQNKAQIEVYNKISDTDWELTMLRVLDELHLDAMPGKTLVLPVSRVYGGIDFPPLVKESEEEYEPA